VIEDTQVNVRISKRAKYAHLAVHADGSVEVTVPRAFPKHALVEFVTENKDWIEKKLQVVEDRRCRNPQLYSLMPNVIDLKAMDEYWTVVYIQSARCKVVQSDTQGLFRELQVYYTEESVIPDLLQKWLQSKAKKHLPPQVECLSRETGLTYAAVSVRGQKTCWGSCSNKKRINLNRSLLFLPSNLVRYLILHELCHTRYMNHSKHFWALVCTFEQQARELDKTISKSVDQIPIWATRR
jgi:predicted metal-dependent hydrolase